MNRTTPMRRTGFARSTPKPAKVYETHVARPRPVALRVPDTRARLTVPVPKLDTVRSKPLLEACRRLACQHCGANAGVAAAHSNWSTHGKGKALKATDVRVAALCWSCHLDIDQGSRMNRQQRQSLWWRAHIRTVQALVALGLWPASIAVPDIERNPFKEASHGSMGRDA